MKATFLLGRAGSGKTTLCLREIRDELVARPLGAPLVLLAPKQATYQLERQLLAMEGIGGFSRLHVLSFERLARLILDTLGVVSSPVLDEVGRVMLVRSLLGRHHGELRVLGGTGRVIGLAQELSRTLAELGHARIGTTRLRSLASAQDISPVLAAKLADLSVLSERFEERLKSQGVAEPGSIFEQAIEVLGTLAVGEMEGRASRPRRAALFAGIWLDGFARLTPQELALLLALARLTERMTLAFCVDGVPAPGLPWHSMWAPVGTTLMRCLNSLQAMAGVEVTVEVLRREVWEGRYRQAPVLGRIEAEWSRGGRAGDCSQRPEARSQRSEDGGPIPSAVSQRPEAGRASCPQRAASEGDRTGVAGGASGATDGAAGWDTPALPGDGSEACKEGGITEAGRAGCPQPAASPCAPSDPTPAVLRLVACANPEAEAMAAAREILRFVRDPGGRYRDAAVLLRSLDGYAEVLRRVFARYDIPCFIDRRESVTHHPVAEGLRYALRVATAGWAHDDWFGLLKTGLVTGDEDAVDRLENLALERGLGAAFWRGAKPSDGSLDLARNSRRAIDEPCWDESSDFRRQSSVVGRGGSGSGSAARGIESWVLRARDAWCPSVVKFCAALEPEAGALGPRGTQLTAALRELWRALGVERTLERWAEGEPGAAGPADQRMAAVHRGVTEQIESLWRNIDLALGEDTMPLTEWLMVIEAGLSALTVGVVPPALDQVVVGTVDRSRNPELRLALVLGANEGVFPATPGQSRLLTDAENDVLASRGLEFGVGRLERIAIERYLGYIAMTRAAERLVVMFSRQDARGVTLQPSALVTRLQRLVPALEVSEETGPQSWRHVEHAVELEKWVVRGVIASGGRTTEAQRPQSPEGRATMDERVPTTDHEGVRAGPEGRASCPQRAAGEGFQTSITEGMSGATDGAEGWDTPPYPGRTLPAAGLCLPFSVFWPPSSGFRSQICGGRLVELRFRTLELREALRQERLSEELAGALFGSELVTSVGALEDFAACPFRYFVGRTLRARERSEFDPDARDHGEFLHAILRRFHERVVASGRRWRDVPPEEGVSWVREIATAVLLEIRHGVLGQSARSRVAMELATESLAGLVRQLLLWASQYGFDPSAVEVVFGEEEAAQDHSPHPPGGHPPALRGGEGEVKESLPHARAGCVPRFPIGEGRWVRVRGRIDRVDVLTDPTVGLPRVVIVDYKTRPRAFDAVKFEAGLELQLPFYLRVACGGVAGLGAMQPAGMFFIGLSGGSWTARGRELGGPDAAEVAATLAAWQHRGRFDGALLLQFDQRGVTVGDQFAYRVKKDGGVDSRCRDVVDAAGLTVMLTRAEQFVVLMARSIVAGEIGVSPWRKGAETACDRCDYRSICRFDPLERGYRMLRGGGGNGEVAATGEGGRMTGDG